jgi:hypothetical protein
MKTKLLPCSGIPCSGINTALALKNLSFPKQIQPNDPKRTNRPAKARAGLSAVAPCAGEALLDLMAAIHSRWYAQLQLPNKRTFCFFLAEKARSAYHVGRDSALADFWSGLKGRRSRRKSRFSVFGWAKPNQVLAHVSRRN